MCNFVLHFQAKIKKHFLSKMFPGMEDFPPAFANDCPGQFDERLPNITLADVEQLRQKVNTYLRLGFFYLD